MDFEWRSHYSVEYDTFCHVLNIKNYYARVDLYNNKEDIYMIIYDFNTNEIKYKSDDFTSVESAKLWIERWAKLGFLVD